MIETTVAVATEPITLAQAKTHCRVEISGDDTYITGLIVVAREYAEHEAGRSFAPQTLKLTLPYFAEPMPLLRSPVTAVTGITYLDTADARQTASSALYYLDRSDLVPCVRLVPGASWPTTSERIGGVEITYTAGTWAIAPVSAIQYMLLLIGSMYEFREADAERAAQRIGFADRLLDRWRIPTV